MCFDSSTGLYSCQLDEQWFNLHKDILRDALDITPTNDNNPFGAPSSTMKSHLVHDQRVPYRKNLSMASCGKKKSSHLLISSVRFVGKDGREKSGMLIPDALLTDAIKRSPYYSEYLEHVAEYQRYLDEEHNKAEEEEAVTESPNATKVSKTKAAKKTKPKAPKAPKVTSPADNKTPKPTSSQPPKPTPAPIEPSKKDQGNKHKLVKEASDTPSHAKRSKAGKVTKKRMPKSPLHLVDEFFDEGKREIVDEQAAHDLLTLQTLKKKRPANQFVYQRRTLMTTEPSGHAESPSLDEEVPEINAGDQDKGQARPNPGEQDEDQAGSNLGDAAESQPQSSHVFHARPNLKHMDLEATDALTQQNPKQMDEEFTITAYRNVQENLKLLIKDQFLVEKPQEKEPKKTNIESEVQSMVTIPIHQDTSSVPPMTTLVIDIVVSQPVSTTPPPPPSLACASEASGTSGASRSSQFPLTPPPPSTAGQESSPTDSMMNDDFIPDELWKPLPEEERLVTPELAWIIPSSNVSDRENNWASALVSTYEPSAKTSLLVKICDMTTFLSWPTLLISKMKAVCYLDFALDLLVLEQLWIGDVFTYDISAKYGISHWWFNRQKFYIDRHDSSSRQKEVRTHMRILSVVSIKVYSRYGYDYLSEIVLRIVDFQEHTIAEKDFKNLYPSDFEDLNLLLLQGHLDHLPGFNKLFPVDNNERKIMRFNEIYKFGDGTLTRILDALDYRVKEFKVKRLNPDLEYLRYGNKGSRPTLLISKMKAVCYLDFALDLLVLEQLWIGDVFTYDISAKYGISHWWFNRQKFYIDRHDSSSRQKEVRTHMRILSVVSIKVYSRYGYDYLSEIVLRIVDFQEHTIAEKDFKNLYPSDFEDLNLLLLQGHLNHLPGFNKRMLSTAVKLWTQNLVTRQRVEDF
uniref:Histone deacetylase 14 n=1 Tax=Tanacetum cinerariifolium TaxID=118510 RepID=A0A6L2LEW1_TANCI|nr:hypothetical protein [Tanacetum cinerariifolium]